MLTGQKRSVWVLPSQICGAVFILIALFLPLGFWWYQAFRKDALDFVRYWIHSGAIDVRIQLMRPAMFRLPTGRFWMGCRAEEPDCALDERPQHEVELSIPFSLSQTEVTQSQFLEVMGYNPSEYRDSAHWRDLPVENVSWKDIVLYCNRLSEKEGLHPCYDETHLQNSDTISDWLGDAKQPQSQHCLGYRLPTEAEWEFAAIAGESTTYAGGSIASEIAWYAAVSNNSPQAVGTQKPNQWGLYDMSGNVWEWVSVGETPYEVWFQKDPSMAAPFKVLRGGAWDSPALELRTRGRRFESELIKAPNVGFRIARSFG